MKLGVLFSGGKDSSLALLKSIEREEVVCLISILSKNSESYMFHTPNIHLTQMQADSMGIPLIQKETEGIESTELSDLRDAVEKARDMYGIEGIVSGVIESVYQAERIQRICHRLDLFCFNPLWKKNQEELLQELVANRFKIIISGIFAYPLNKSWLGREIDRKVIDELTIIKQKYGISPSGEGGEIETTTLDAPFFKKRIEVVEYETEYERNAGVFLIEKARLVEK